jgi:hypothetical protein
MDPVNLKKSLYIKQKMLMFGLGGYRHNHPPYISLSNSVMSPRDENCTSPRRGQFSSLGDVTSIPCEIESQAVISRTSLSTVESACLLVVHREYHAIPRSFSRVTPHFCLDHSNKMLCKRGPSSCCAASYSTLLKSAVLCLLLWFVKSGDGVF